MKTLIGNLAFSFISTFAHAQDYVEPLKNCVNEGIVNLQMNVQDCLESGGDINLCKIRPSQIEELTQICKTKYQKICINDGMIALQWAVQDCLDNGGDINLCKTRPSQIEELTKTCEKI